MNDNKTLLTLDQIGHKHGTDKAHAHHFTINYAKYFDELRDQPIKLLEIGVLRGRSLRMWDEYFYNSEIICGADINDLKHLETGKIKILTVNQEKKEELLKINGVFDIVIDDGGHTMFQQQLTLITLFANNVKSGGYYVLEDLHTSVFSSREDYGATDTNNTLQLLIDLKNKKPSEDNNYHITEEEFYMLVDNITEIDICYNNDNGSSITSIIRKK